MRLTMVMTVQVVGLLGTVRGDRQCRLVVGGVLFVISELGGVSVGRCLMILLNSVRSRCVTTG